MAVYGSMAYVYDRLMTHVDYTAWVDGLSDAWRHLGTKPEKVADLGCGTGSVLLPLAEQGYGVFGVDNAPEMLAVCQDKLNEASLTASLWEMDIRNLRLPETVDAAVCLCDTLNYLGSEKELSRCFKSVARSLKPGGSFIFDMRTLHYYQNVLGESQWVEDEGDIVLIWNNDFSQAPAMTIDLTFFVKQGSGLYRRFEEQHRQVYFPVQRVRELIEKAGMSLVWTGGDFNRRTLDEAKDERVYFAAVKS